MSDYCHYKVLRVPFDKYFPNINPFDFEEEHSQIFCNKPGYFIISPTEIPYIDFIIKYEFDYEAGDWGKIRNLYPSEMIIYYDIFKLLIPNIDMTDVHLVEYCWYDGYEAPNYYDISNDDFYQQVEFIDGVTKNVCN